MYHAHDCYIRVPDFLCKVESFVVSAFLWMWNLISFLEVLITLQPLYGFASGDPLRFRRALGHSDLFYVEDIDLEFKEVPFLPTWTY